MQIEPDLAQSYSHPTPLTWVYDIRPGVKFWDGTPLTAKDVAYSLQRQIEPSVGSVYLEPAGVMIASVKQTGPMQVTITTHRAASNVLISNATHVKSPFTDERGHSLGTK